MGWDEYLKPSDAQLDRLAKQQQMTLEGIRSRQIGFMHPDFLDGARPFHLTGLPLNVVFAVPELGKKMGHQASLLATLPLDDCELVTATTESTRVGTEHFNEDEKKALQPHSYIRADGCIMDVTSGLVWMEKAFNEIERPEPLQVLSRAECMEDFFLQAVLATDFKHAKYMLPFDLPAVEKTVAESEHVMANKRLKQGVQTDIANLKKAVDYDKLVTQFQLNNKNLSVEKLQQIQMLVAQNMFPKGDISKKAKLYMERVAKNPTTNAYELP